MTDTDLTKKKTAEELRAMIDGGRPEEEIHQFFKERIFGVGIRNPRFSERFIYGTISKFPIAPDRVPDFASILLNVAPSQRSSRITFIELKRADAPLYTSHSRMSKDLNDAWMECVETSRLIADNFRDCLRRMVKTLDRERLPEFNEAYRTAGQEIDGENYGGFDGLMPYCSSVIVIGRRSSLDSEGLLRTRELSASTARGIQVMTYDTVLDWVAESEDDDYSLFMRGWYW